MSTLLSSLRTFLMVIVSLIGVSYASAQVDEWAGPQAPFPTQNIAAPVNTSSEEQTKEGLLTLGGLISTSDTTLLTTLRVATTTDPLTKSLKALFAGNIGAKEYCDEKGENCVASNGLGGGIQKIVYFDPTDTANYHYTKTFTSNVAPTGTADSPGFISGYGSFTLADLKANIPKIAEETRVIDAIIVDYTSNISLSGTPYSSLAIDKWYTAMIGGNSQSFYYNKSTIKETVGVEGRHLTIFQDSLYGQTSFKVPYYLFRENRWSDVHSSVKLVTVVRIAGYIAR